MTSEYFKSISLQPTVNQVSLSVRLSDLGISLIRHIKAGPFFLLAIDAAGLVEQ